MRNDFKIIFFFLFSLKCYFGFSQTVELIKSHEEYDISNRLLSVGLDFRLIFERDTSVYIRYKHEYDVLKKNGDVFLGYTLELDEDICIVLDNGKEIAYYNSIHSDCRRDNYFKNPRVFIFKKNAVYSLRTFLFDAKEIIDSIEKYGDPNSKGLKVIYKLLNKSKAKEVFRFEYDLSDIYK